MKELNRYDFTNDRHFAMHLLAPGDIVVRDLPECDVLAFESESEKDGPRWLHLRPDEALILARLLIDAVWQVTEGYTVAEKPKVSDIELRLNDKQIHYRSGADYQ